MKALVFDNSLSLWHLYDSPCEVFESSDPDDIPGIIERIESRCREDKMHSVIAISYEAAPAFDRAFPKLKKIKTVPLFFAAVYESRSVYPDPIQAITAFGLTPDTAAAETSSFIGEVTALEYAEKIALIKNYLKRGESYQINFTFRLRARYEGEPLSWFLERARNRPGNYLCYIKHGTLSVCSFSPELFFERTEPDASGQSTLTFKPMKGTRKPGNDGNDEESRTLVSDPKNRAENLMIVDMIRNDAGKIAIPGTVGTPRLFEAEVYPTVIQMTSTITARSNSGLDTLLKALYPCASITGAPKLRTMEIIDELEKSPRGLYTGSIMTMDACGNVRSSVAIRTAVFDRASRSVEYGTGSGITWLSTAGEEFEECRLKTRILDSPDDFHVFESLLLEEGRYFLFDKHLERLERSLRYFYYIECEARVAEARDSLVKAIETHRTGRWKVRLALYGTGRANDLRIEEASVLASPYTIALSPLRVNSGNPFLVHKTSVRSHIEAAVRSRKDACDVILVNEREELCETSRGNLVLDIGGTLYTPRADSGLLRGTFRDFLLDNGEIMERTLYPTDLFAARRIYMINSVRKWTECVLLSEP